jgi:hypothetical protein
VNISDEVKQLVTRVEQLEARANPGTRDLVVQQDVDAIRKQWQIPAGLEGTVLNPQYVDALRQNAEQQFDGETKALDADIAPAFAPIRAAIGERLASARRVPLESERVNPDAPTYVTAKLLDAIASREAREWLDAQADNLPAIEARYRASDDRRDCHLVQLIEARFGLTSETPEDESRSLPIMPLRKLVRDRQNQRIPAALREAISAVDAAESRYTQARASALPSRATLQDAVGELIRRAK